MTCQVMSGPARYRYAAAVVQDERLHGSGHRMPLLLLELSAHPGEIAATKAGTCAGGGAFFLDFSRPLAVERWLGVWNFRVGVPLALHVPVVHEGERAGLRTVAVEKGDPYFAELQTLWRTRHPTARTAPATPAAPATVSQDFARHFPADATPNLRAPATVQ